MVISANRLDHMVRSNPALASALIKDLVNRMLKAEDVARDAEKRALEAEARATEAEQRLREPAVMTAAPRRPRTATRGGGREGSRCEAAPEGRARGVLSVR